MIASTEPYFFLYLIGCPQLNISFIIIYKALDFNVSFLLTMCESKSFGGGGGGGGGGGEPEKRVVFVRDYINLLFRQDLST